MHNALKCSGQDGQCLSMSANWRLHPYPSMIYPTTSVMSAANHNRDRSSATDVGNFLRDASSYCGLSVMGYTKGRRKSLGGHSVRGFRGWTTGPLPARGIILRDSLAWMPAECFSCISCLEMLSLSCSRSLGVEAQRGENAGDSWTL